MESKPPPFFFQFFLATIQTKLRTLLKEEEGAIYIHTTVATGAGAVTMPIASKDHNNNE
jgi:hypothetical protein